MGIGGFFKKVGKGLAKVAPIAAMFVPGLQPVGAALLGAGAGALSGAVSGGKKGALIGGLMGGATGGLGAGAASSAATSAGGSGMNAGGFMKSLLSSGALEAAGKGIAGAAQSTAKNRGAELEAMLAADQMRLAQGEDRRAEESDIMKKMQILSYLQSRGSMPTEMPKSASGIQFPRLLSAPPPVSAEQKNMAATLMPQLQARLANPMSLRDYDSKMKAGAGEKALSWLGPILNTAGAATREPMYPTSATPTAGGPTGGMDFSAMFKKKSPTFATNPFGNK